MRHLKNSDLDNPSVTATDLKNAHGYFLERSNLLANCLWHPLGQRLLASIGARTLVFEKDRHKTSRLPMLFLLFKNIEILDSTAPLSETYTTIKKKLKAVAVEFHDFRTNASDNWLREKTTDIDQLELALGVRTQAITQKMGESFWKPIQSAIVRGWSTLNSCFTQHWLQRTRGG